MKDPAVALIERIHQEMRQAMKNQQHHQVDELKSLLSRISNTEAITPQRNLRHTHSPIAGAKQGVGTTEAPRRQLTSDTIRSIIQDEMHEIEAALERIDANSLEAAVLREKITVIQKYL